MSAQKEEWRDIPGYGGWYQISTEGRVRSFKTRGNHSKNNQRMETPRLLTTRIKRPKNRSRGECLVVTLHDESGKHKVEYITKLMAETWMGGCPPGCSTRTKNGNSFDVRLSNLHFVTKEDAVKEMKRAQLKAARPYCKKLPVLKIDDTLTVVEAYPSARQAALAAKLPRCTIQYYCNFKFKKSAFAPDGYIYSWDDSRRVWAMLKRAMRELDNKGIPYNSPFTGRYFDLPQDDDPNIDVDTLWWSQVLTPAGGGATSENAG